MSARPGAAVHRRLGAGKLGCLVTVLLVVTIGYFGVNVGEVYLRYYKFKDAMTQEVRFASARSDDALRQRFASLADSLDLPDEAGRIRIARTSSRIRISADYSEYVELPLLVREFRFHPSAEGDR